MAVLPPQPTHSWEKMREGEEDLEEGLLHFCFLLLTEGARSHVPPPHPPFTGLF